MNLSHAQANDREVIVRIAGEQHPRPLDVFLLVIADDVPAPRADESEEALDVGLFGVVGPTCRISATSP